MNTIGERLEKYTAQHPQEVLIVTAEINRELDQIFIFKGYSSSLMRPTACDPDIPVLPSGARIIEIDRAVAPYNPASPRYIQQGLTPEAIESLLGAAGV